MKLKKQLGFALGNAISLFLVSTPSAIAESAIVEEFTESGFR